MAIRKIVGSEERATLIKIIPINTQIPGYVLVGFFHDIFGTQSRAAQEYGGRGIDRVGSIATKDRGIDIGSVATKDRGEMGRKSAGTNHCGRTRLCWLIFGVSTDVVSLIQASGRKP